MLRLFGKIAHHIAYGLDVGQYLVGDLHVEFLLHIHDQLHNVQRVRVQIVDQAA